ncbi:unnamed protein product [Blepharisma stoltei]|uniref:ADP/ATP translocase n=1 Tax=Blepharisma stoltei TaxID=1481888 RepID=A0AAU9K2A0_9CILI|nr:unnamed protein product [Blepharisma stoltei]
MTDKSLSNFAVTATVSALSKNLTEAPLDRVKLLLQLQPDISQLYPNNKYKGIFDCTIRVYKGMNDCAYKIWKADGIRGFFRGVWLSFPGVFIYRGMYFGLFNTLKNSVDSNNFFAIFLLAQSITTFSGLTVYPIDTVRRRMIMQTGKFPRTDPRLQEEFKNHLIVHIKCLEKKILNHFMEDFDLISLDLSVEPYY